MKIFIVNDQFESGGAGRVASVLCNGLYNRGYAINIVSDNINYRTLYDLNTNISFLPIDTNKYSNRVLRWLSCAWQIRRYIKIEHPEVIICIQAWMYFITLIATIGIRIPILAADHTSFDRDCGAIINFIRFRLYGLSDGLSILTHKDERILADRFPQKRVIYNPLPFTPLDAIPKRRNTILCAGRLEAWHIKGFDLMLEAWSRIANLYPDWTLEIAGSGTEHDKLILKNLISSNKLSQQVQLLGNVDDMKALYAKSSIFVLSSRVEGFPMVLLEAMSQGCACLAFSIRGAIDEMIGTSKGCCVLQDGNIGELTQMLDEFIKNEKLRTEYSLSAVKSVQRFSKDTFLNDWEVFINDVV